MRTFRLCLAVISCVCSAGLRSSLADNPEQQPAPVFGQEIRGAAIAIAPLSVKYKLHEPISIKVVVRNENTNYDMGVYIWGSRGATGVKPLLFDAAGAPVPKTWPEIRGAEMGGSSVQERPKPGEMASCEYELPKWYTPQHPGTYRLVLCVYASWYKSGKFHHGESMFSNMIEINVVAETEAQP